MVAVVVIVPLLIFALLMFLFIKKARLHGKVNQEIFEMEKSVDKGIEIMSRILESPSYSILVENNERQLVRINIDSVIDRDSDIASLTSDDFILLESFSNFLIVENNQFPVYFSSKNEILTSVIDSDSSNTNQIATKFICIDNLEEFVNDFS